MIFAGNADRRVVVGVPTGTLRVVDRRCVMTLTKEKRDESKGRTEGTLTDVTGSTEMIDQSEETIVSMPTDGFVARRRRFFFESSSFRRTRLALSEQIFQIRQIFDRWRRWWRTTGARTVRRHVDLQRTIDRMIFFRNRFQLAVTVLRHMPTF